MDISTLKEKLGDETFTKLQTYVTDLIGQRDAARQESIDGRKGKDKKITDLSARVEAFAERLGVEPDADLETLPDAKGLADASKQVEAKLKKMQRDLEASNAARDEAVGKFRDSQKKAAVAEALAGHEFIARDIVETYVGQSLTWEGDDLLFKSSDGKLIPVKDGVAEIAKSRPELLKSAGAGGAGFRQSNAGSGDGKTMTRAQFDAASPAERMAHSKAGGKVVDA